VKTLRTVAGSGGNFNLGNGLRRRIVVPQELGPSTIRDKILAPVLDFGGRLWQSGGNCTRLRWSQTTWYVPLRRAKAMIERIFRRSAAWSKWHWRPAVLVMAGPAVGPAMAADAPAAKPAAQPKGESLFDGKTLKGWKAPQFGGEGKVEVKDGTIVLERGDTMTGITYTGKVPTVDYELSLEAKRVDGVDFFATTTFPVGGSHCSFVVGGWGGPVVGLSSIDHYDAADNQTSKTKSFKLNQWYRLRIRVTQQKIECWIDDEKMVDLSTTIPRTRRILPRITRSRSAWSAICAGRWAYLRGAPRGRSATSASAR